MTGYGEWCMQDVGDDGCAAPYVCYVNASWNDNVSLCTCSHWYGWSGEDCLGLSGASYFILTSAGVQGALALLALVIASVVLASYVKLNGLKPNVQAATMLMIWLATLFLICWRAVIMIITLTPEHNTLEAKANDEGRVHQLVPVERVMIALTLCFGTLALLNVSLIWVQVALQSKRMTHSMSRGLTSYRRTVYVFESIWVLGLIVLNALGLTGIITIFAAPFILFMIVCFAYGASKMSSLLSEVYKLSSNKPQESNSAAAAANFAAKPAAIKASDDRRAKQYNELVSLIRRTAIRVVISLVFAFLTAGAYAGMTLLPGLGQRSTIHPGYAVHTVVLFNEGIPFFVLCGLLSVLFYLRINIMRPLRNKRSAMAASRSARNGGVSGPSRVDEEPNYDASSFVASTATSFHRNDHPSL